MQIIIYIQNRQTSRSLHVDIVIVCVRACMHAYVGMHDYEVLVGQVSNTIVHFVRKAPNLAH